MKGTTPNRPQNPVRGNGRTCLGILLLLVIVSPPSIADETSYLPLEGAFGARMEVEFVELDLVAVDRKGEPVRDLLPEEVRICEDGEPVELSLVLTPQPPRASTPVANGTESPLKVAEKDPWEQTRIAPRPTDRPPAALPDGVGARNGFGPPR